MDVVFLGLFLELGFRHKINEIDTILRQKRLHTLKRQFGDIWGRSRDKYERYFYFRVGDHA